MASQRQAINEADITTAMKIIERWVMCTRLTILLGNIRYCRGIQKKTKKLIQVQYYFDPTDIVREYHHDYVEISKANLKEAIYSLKVIQDAIGMFPPELYDKHSTIHDIFCFFSKQTRLEDANKRDNLV